MTNVKRAVRAAYILGKAGVPARNGMFDSLIARASRGDRSVRYGRLAALRRDCQLTMTWISARPHKVDGHKGMADAGRTGRLS